MIFSEQWIREWVDPPADTRQLVKQLTMAGLEVGGCAPVAGKFHGIVVGEVLSVAPHPNADKLRVCSVADGQGVHQVVCGAPNVEAGMKVPFARVGASLEPQDGQKPIEIRAARLRDVESAGMLCSADELGLEDSSEGLLSLPEDAPVGADLRDYLGLDDNSMELDLTPNRGDCLSIAGLAREIGALNSIQVSVPEIESVPAEIDDVFPVHISAGDACPRYLGRVIRGIDPSAGTPGWMKEKLRRCGLRSIDPVVDVTNFVLLELGQPMHAFDLSLLRGGIDVRLAAEGESLTLLDGKDVSLNADTLVIADAAGPVAMAGIMGGERSAVAASTRDVFLECAFFAPLAIAGRARGYGLHTDASHRYERGVDYNLQRRATERATQLLLEIVGGQAGPIAEAIGTLPEARRVALRFASLPRHLGIEVPGERIRDILTGLGLTVEEETAQSLTLNVPSFRFDIEIEADLIEEVARVYGYENIPSGSGLGIQTLTARSEARLPLSRLKSHLASLGYQEVVTYSFIEPELSKRLAGTESGMVPVENPISSDMAMMRASILPGLLSTLRYNESRQQGRARLFESGLVFRQVAGGYEQPNMIAGLVAGSRLPTNWSNSNELSDFYDVKGDIETLLALGGRGAEFSVAPDSHPAMQDGQCGRILAGNEPVGHVGALDPSLQRDLGIKGRVYLFELQLEPILRRRIPRSSALSRFPEVSRDLAILVDNATPAADILAAVCETAGEFLSDLRIFDVYQGDAIEIGKKSIAMGLTWQHPSRTLNDDEVNGIIASCIKALEEKFEARLRTAG